MSGLPWNWGGEVVNEDKDEGDDDGEGGFTITNHIYSTLILDTQLDHAQSRLLTEFIDILQAVLYLCCYHSAWRNHIVV